MISATTVRAAARATALAGLLTLVAGCGANNPFGPNAKPAPDVPYGREPGTRTIWDLFRNSEDPNTTVEVNKYLWNASLDVLNFLPIQTVDPFTGVIVTGFGTPPGGGRSYRATIYVQDPALDARSLKVALVSQGGGPVAPETARAVEDAILTRARELRVADGRL